MAIMRPELPNGWDVEGFILARYFTQKARVLFIYSEDFLRLKKIQEALDLQVTILHDDLDLLEKARQFGFEVIAGNVNAGGLDDIEKKSFNYVVAEDNLNSARYPSDFLTDTLRVCDDLILSNKNQAHWRRRLRFLFSGSMYTKNQYDIVPDDNDAWYNKFPWLFSHKDIVNLCACKGLTIKKGTIIYRNGYIDNMYDLRSYPNLKAEKVYYLITDVSSSVPSYRLGGATF